MIERVLIADDDPLLLSFLQETLQRKGKEIVAVTNGKEAIEEIKKGSFDLIITDMRMPYKTGLDVLHLSKKQNPMCPVIMATAHGTVEAAVEAMKMGAFNYLLKPFSLEALESCLEKAEEHVHLLRENTFLKEEHTKYTHLIAESPIMRQILQKAKTVAQSNASVFITGESGTGKEVIGAAIHKLSPRSQSPFIKVNCAAIPETLIESEFFGHERGAFTGALQRKLGRFELAHHGTLLLDEVTEIPMNLQAKLLRAIQEQEFERVGGMRSIQVNVRFLATSNRNMQEAIATKSFREDLFYRLNVVPIHIPPLRERPEDIVALSQHFLKRCCIENHKPLKQLTVNALQKLMRYSWPGNVRELGNVIERTVVLHQGCIIDEADLYLDPNPTKIIAPLPPSSELSLDEVEKQTILQTLKANQNNRTKTAKALKINIRTLRNKLRSYQN